MCFTPTKILFITLLCFVFVVCHELIGALSGLSGEEQQIENVYLSVHSCYVIIFFVRFSLAYDLS